MNKTPKRIPTVVEQRRGAQKLLDGLTPPQRAFIEDPSRYKSALTSRRAGKTHALMAYTLATAVEREDSVIIYMSITAGHARKTFFRPLLRTLEKLNIPVVPNESEQSVQFANGSIIYATGADTEREIRKQLGYGLDLIVIDECGSWGPHLRELVDENVIPTLMDHDGTLCLTGSPKGPMDARANLFFQATSGDHPGYSLHSWTWRDNAHNLKDPFRWFEEEKVRRGLTDDDDAQIQREFFGLWARDTERLVYPFDPKRNTIVGPLPGGSWTYVMGLDFGARHDLSTFVVAGWTDASPNLYFLHAEGRRRMLTDDRAAVIERLRRHFDPSMRLIADCGALGAGLADELRVRYGLPVEAADKTEKPAFQSFMADDLRTGRIKAVHPSPLTDEWSKLQKLEDGSGREDPSQFNDFCDAGLYAYRHCRPYLFRPEEPRVDLRKYMTAQQLATEDARRWAKETDDQQFRRPLGELEALWGTVAG